MVSAPSERALPAVLVEVPVVERSDVRHERRSSASLLPARRLRRRAAGPSRRRSGGTRPCRPDAAAGALARRQAPARSASGSPARPSTSWLHFRMVSPPHHSGAIRRPCRGASGALGPGHLAQNRRHHTSPSFAGLKRSAESPTPVSSGRMSTPAATASASSSSTWMASIYRGREAVPGAAALVAALTQPGCSSASRPTTRWSTRAGYVERLGEHGNRDRRSSEIVTSTSATIDHLRAHLPRRSLRPGGWRRGHARPSCEAAGLRCRRWPATPACLPQHGGAAGTAGSTPWSPGSTRRSTTGAWQSAMRAISDGARLHRHQRGPALSDAGRLPARRRRRSWQPWPPRPASTPRGHRQAGAGHVRAPSWRPPARAAGRRGRRRRQPRRRTWPAPIARACASILVLTGVADAALAATLDGERRPDAIAADPAEVPACSRRAQLMPAATPGVPRPRRLRVQRVDAEPGRERRARSR